MQKLIHAHHDGELDAANTLQVDEHLADCPSCFNSIRQLSTLRSAIQNAKLRYDAPAGLRQTIAANVARAEKAERQSVFIRPWFQQLGWAAAAALLITCAVGFHLLTARTDGHLLADLTEAHVRSLMANHLTDVASTDQHTVKPWFDGQVPFAPPVKELREAGFPLLGGRLDYVDGHPAAALIYGRHKHVINLFIWPATSASARAPRSTQREGYNVVQWSDGRMDCHAVSDLNETELREFARDWAAR